jgi:hypothetical protein
MFDSPRPRQRYLSASVPDGCLTIRISDQEASRTTLGLSWTLLMHTPGTTTELMPVRSGCHALDNLPAILQNESKGSRASTGTLPKARLMLSIAGKNCFSDIRPKYQMLCICKVKMSWRVICQVSVTSPPSTHDMFLFVDLLERSLNASHAAHSPAYRLGSLMRLGFLPRFKLPAVTPPGRAMLIIRIH